MKKTILVTGATDGIGFETAKMLVSMDHHVILHGRNRSKLDKVFNYLADSPATGQLQSCVADLSRLAEVEEFAREIAEKNEQLDVLINNAGIFTSPDPLTDDGVDVRFAVNTIAPYLLTQKLLPLLGSAGRVINLSSAAQAPVNTEALAGRQKLTSDGDAYAQSKLALTMWTRHLALTLGPNGPAVIAVNPKSLLGSKMVTQAYGVVGSDLRIGADILCRAALSDEFATATGQYFDNDIGQFTNPHPDALNPQKCAEIVSIIETLVAHLSG